MEVEFLKSVKPTIRWFKRYYIALFFSEGRRNAEQKCKAPLNLLESNPMIGKLVHDLVDARECLNKNTPFTLRYRVRPERIKVL